MNQHQHITMSMFPPQPLSMIWLGSPCHAFTTGSIEGGTMFVTVQAAATLEASDLRVTKVEVAGLQVTGKHSHLSLSASKVHAHLSPRLEKYVPDGVIVVLGARAVLKKCHLSGCGDGLVAKHERSLLEAEDCTLQQNVQSGAVAGHAAKLVVRGCHSSENGLYGFHAKSKATMTASDCSASNCEDTGFAVVAGAQAVLKKCSAGKNGKHGVFAGGEGSRLEVEGCTLQQNVSCGAFAADTAELVVRCCRSTANGQFGFLAQTQATLTARD